MIKGALTSDNNSCRRSLHANAGYRLWVLLSHASIWEAGVLGVPDRERARSRGPRSRQSTRSAPRQARRGPIRPNYAMIGGFHSSSSVSSHTPVTSSNSPMVIASKAAQRGNRSPSAQAPDVPPRPAELPARRAGGHQRLGAVGDDPERLLAPYAAAVVHIASYDRLSSCAPLLLRNEQPTPSPSGGSGRVAEARSRAVAAHSTTAVGVPRVA